MVFLTLPMNQQGRAMPNAQWPKAKLQKKSSWLWDGSAAGAVILKDDPGVYGVFIPSDEDRVCVVGVFISLGGPVAIVRDDERTEVAYSSHIGLLGMLNELDTMP